MLEWLASLTAWHVFTFGAGIFLGFSSLDWRRLSCSETAVILLLCAVLARLGPPS